MRNKLINITNDHKGKDTIKTVHGVWEQGGVRLQGAVMDIV